MRLQENLNQCVKSIVFSIVLFGGLILGGCQRREPPPPVITEVAIVTVNAERVLLTAELPGRTSAYLVAEIRPQVNGIIQKRLFDEGSEVRTGEVLYQIDPAPLPAACA